MSAATLAMSRFWSVHPGAANTNEGMRRIWTAERKLIEPGTSVWSSSLPFASGCAFMHSRRFYLASLLPRFADAISQYCCICFCFELALVGTLAVCFTLVIDVLTIG